MQLRQAEECLNEDVRTLEKEFTADADITTVRMIPLYSELQWATLRDTQAAKHLKLETIDVVGAKATASADGWGYILWFHLVCFMFVETRRENKLLLDVCAHLESILY